MEHIVQFAIGIDDEAIRKNLEESAVNQIVNKFYADFKDSMKLTCSESRFQNHGTIHDGIRFMVRENVEKITSEYKDAIIAEAANILADRLLKTKAAKEMLKNVVESDASAE